MSRTFHHQRSDRRIRARGIRQDPPDLRRVARTLIALAMAQAEADAQALVKDSASGSSTTKKKRAASEGTAGPSDQKESA